MRNSRFRRLFKRDFRAVGMATPVGYGETVGNSPQMQYYSAPGGFTSVAQQVSEVPCELIPHRIFVGGFTNNTTDADLKDFFEKYFNVREVKVIRHADTSKCYGFVTFDTEAEAKEMLQVANKSPESMFLRGRRLNLGPALRRMVPQRYSGEYAMATPSGLIPSPTLGYSYSYPQQLPHTQYMMHSQYAPQNQVGVVPPVVSQSPSAEDSMISPAKSISSMYNHHYMVPPSTPMTPSYRLHSSSMLSPLHAAFFSQTQPAMSGDGMIYSQMTSPMYYTHPTPFLTPSTTIEYNNYNQHSIYLPPTTMPSPEQQQQYVQQSVGVEGEKGEEVHSVQSRCIPSLLAVKTHCRAVSSLTNHMQNMTVDAASGDYDANESMGADDVF